MGKTMPKTTTMTGNGKPLPAIKMMKLGDVFVQCVLPTFYGKNSEIMIRHVGIFYHYVE